ncbi:MAG: hypothetical protein ACK5V3_02420 [Bdellovibrionales bacterium]
MRQWPFIIKLSQVLIFSLLISCESIKNVNVPVPKPGEEEILSCDNFKPDQEFNGLRLKAFQDLVSSYNQKLKSLPTTPFNTEKIAFLERMRRRTTWPVISIKLRPALMTETLNNEMNALSEFFRSRPPVSKEDDAFLNRMNSELRAKLENPDSWLCPAKVVVPKVPPPIPPVIKEKDPSGQNQTIIFDN